MKNLFFPLLFFAAAMSSCSSDAPTAGASASAADSGDLVAINVYAGTTRGQDVDTFALEESLFVELHIDDSGTISESLTFEFVDGDWVQTDDSQIKWSSVLFPANFYSMHDGSAFGELTFDPDAAVYTDYTVEAGESSAHRDLVYHASQIEAIPVGGQVSAYHKHALSKIHLYAATGTNNVYIANVKLVNVDSDGTITITPLTDDSAADASDIDWDLGDFTAATYQYYYIGDEDPSAFNSELYGSDPIINDLDTAPMMIVPQETTAATAEEIVSSGSSDSYIEVIYYMTNSLGNPLVGFSAVSERTDADDFIGDNQGITLYVKAGFPLAYEFEPNKEYDITLGLGAENTTGGILIDDFYVDKDGVEIKLTSSDDGSESTVEIPDIDAGDDVLENVDALIDITVTATVWGSGDSVSLESNDALE